MEESTIRSPHRAPDLSGSPCHRSLGQSSRCSMSVSGMARRRRQEVCQEIGRECHEPSALGLAGRLHSQPPGAPSLDT
eukprot:6036504-Heterocapsa_arctica.AAC.1